MKLREIELTHKPLNWGLCVFNGIISLHLKNYSHATKINPL